MSLSRHEQLLLHRVNAALRRTDPDLAVKFAIFRQAADGEPVPGHERLAGSPGGLDWVRSALAWLARPAARRRSPGPAAWPAHPGHGFPRIVQEDPMSAISHVSPLPPDQTGGGHSPLPPDPARDGHTSPLPPDPRLADVSPVPPPRPAPDDQHGADGDQDGESRPGSDGAR